MEIKIMIEYLSIYRQTCKLTIGKLFEINSKIILLSLFAPCTGHFSLFWTISGQNEGSKFCEN
jgi:hypothetical protein